MVDTLSRSERSVRMALVRSKDAKPAMAVRRLVFGLGYRYARGLPAREQFAELLGGIGRSS